MRSVTCVTLRPCACLRTVWTTALERSNSCTVAWLGLVDRVGRVRRELLGGLEDERDTAPDGLLDHGAQPDAHLLDRLGLAGHDDDLARPAAGDLDEAQDAIGVH